MAISRKADTMRKKNSTNSAEDREYSISSGLIDEKPNPSRNDWLKIAKEHFLKNDLRIAIIDGVPSVFVYSEEVQSWVWTGYEDGMFTRLMGEMDDAIKDKYKLTHAKKPDKIPIHEFKYVLKDLFMNAPKIDSFQGWIKSLIWDGKDRMKYVGKAMGLSIHPRGQTEGYKDISSEEEDLYIFNIIHMIIVGAIQRHFEPFIQQAVPILIGDGGIGKTGTLRALSVFPDKWYSYADKYTMSEGHSNELREFSRKQKGCLIFELKEIESILTKDNTGMIKSILDTEYAEYRDLYQSNRTRTPYTAFWVGTTNHDAILHDKTGNRRFMLAFMEEQKDTPNRESLTDIEYLEKPIFLGTDDDEHKKFIEQLFAQGYEEYLRGITYDFYYKNRPEIKKIQNILNETALVEPEGMELLVSMIRYECDHNPYGKKFIIWSEFVKKFQQEEGFRFSETARNKLYKSFKENPRRFGFSSIKTFRLGTSVYGTEYGKGYELQNPELCDLFTKGLSESEY